MQNEQMIEMSSRSESGSSEQNINNPERIASAVAGGALVAYGINQGGILGTTLTLLGGGLLYRGGTGHCHVYDAAGINTNDPSKTTVFGSVPGVFSGTVRVKKAVTVNRSPAEVYEYWRNFENF